MEHLALFFIVTSSLVGAAAIARSMFTYSLNRKPYLKYFTLFVGLVLLANLTSLLANYLEINKLYSDSYSPAVFSISEMGLTFASILCLMLSIRCLLEKTLKLSGFYF